MSNTSTRETTTTCEAGSTETCVEVYPARTAKVGAIEIRRALPVRQHRLVGPWCFLDRYGPLSFTDEKPMDVAPHPHIGLQTVSWLLEGEVLHRDSLGYESVIRPGELNIMTSGRAISHSEETPGRNSGILSGVQLWIALPESVRHGAPDFAHHGELPSADLKGGSITVFAGRSGALVSPAAVHSPLVGAEIRIEPGAKPTMDLESSFEHALFVLEGRARFADQPLEPDVLYYLGTGRDELPLQSDSGARILLVGGVPFGEPIVMWWNFVARSHEEIAEAREAWEKHERFGSVVGYRGARLDAPALKERARPPAAS